MTVAAVLAATLGGVVPAAVAADDRPGTWPFAAGEPVPSGERGATAGGAAGGSGSASGSTASGAVAASYADGLLRRTATIAELSESVSPTAAQQVMTTVVTQDVVAQNVRATVSFAAAPTAEANSLVYVLLGEWNGSSCSPRVMLGAEARPGGSVTGVHVDAAGQVAGTFGVARSDSGTALTLTSAAAGAFRAADLECAFTMVLSVDGATRYQSFYAETLDEVFKPILKVTGGEPVQGARAGKWTTLRLRVSNTGSGKAENVKIRAKGSSMTIKKASRSLGAIDARSNENGITYKVKLKGAKSRKITFTVTADGGYKAKKSFTIAREPAPKKYKSLAGRYFWGFHPSSLASSSGWDNTTMRFLDSKWVYVGDMKGRTPKCRKATKACKRYSYNARTGVAKIDKQKFRVTTKGFSYKVAKGEQKSSFSAATLPKKGTRIKADLVHQNWSGYCMITCTSWTERLTLARNGRFVWSEVSVGSWPGIGTSWSSAPPDKRGSYKIVKKGVIELRYANGKKKRQTIAIEHDVRGKPSPAGAGVVIGLTNFYHQD